MKVGDTLPRRVIGPHTIASFTTEYRAFLFNIWGTFHWLTPDGVDKPWVYDDPGWTEGFAFDEVGAMIDPRLRDGLYVGPSRGHIDAERASEVGMARAYGYGATMGAWCTDYLAYWAGHDGMVRHTKQNFRLPSFEGDITFVDAEIIGKQENSEWGVPLVQVKLLLTNQDGGVLVDCKAEVELPVLRTPASRSRWSGPMSPELSLVSGPPLDSEPGLGALTLPGVPARGLHEIRRPRGARPAHAARAMSAGPTPTCGTARSRSRARCVPAASARTAASAS